MAGNSVAKFFAGSWGKTSVWDAVKAGGWKVFFDGSLAQQTLVQGPGATLVGTDAAGNKYYQRMTEQYGELTGGRRRRSGLGLACAGARGGRRRSAASHAPPPRPPKRPHPCPSGRHRWVIYGNPDWQTGQDARSVPAEWHGWLHNISDDVPTNAESPLAHPAAYALPNKGHVSGTSKSYAPKGSWTNPAERNWVKVQAWNPVDGRK